MPINMSGNFKKNYFTYILFDVGVGIVNVLHQPGKISARSMLTAKMLRLPKWIVQLIEPSAVITRYVTIILFKIIRKSCATQYSTNFMVE